MNWAWLLPVLLLATGCNSSLEREYRQGQAAANRASFQEAFNAYEKVALRSPESEIGLQATREAARIAFYETKNFAKAVEFYRALVLNSKDPEERLKAQKQVTSIYLEHLNNYAQAIIELNKLLPLIQDAGEKMQYKMNLARAYYYQNNFFQAEMEVDEFLRISKNEDQNFQMVLLKANIALARKDLQRAAEILRDVIKKNPQRAQKENVGLILAVAYEEMKDYKGAIAALQELRSKESNTELIDIRIKRLQERLKNQPGAKGYHK